MSNATLSIILRAVGASQAAGEVGKLDSAIGKVGKTSEGLSKAKLALAAVGAAATTALAAGVRGGIESLADLEDAVSSVKGAIDQDGLAGQVTGEQVAAWANQIESDVQAAFDDKDITAATASLIRYGKVSADNLKPAMVVMTDLAAKTGDVGSASELLAKAMADPTAAAGKLARVGVILTDEQQDQIKAMEKAGDVAGEQRVLLDALARSTKGAAAASKGPFRDALNTFKDTVEDAQRALGIGFLPLIQRVADMLRTKLADPKVVSAIEGFGSSLAAGFDRLITLAGQMPWGSIADAFSIVGTGAKAALDLFLGMPAWVQTAVVTGWGVDKLTGGALGDVVGNLASGLIKGVLGINAGVVNVNAAVVNGGGGAVDVVGDTVKGGGILATLKAALATGGAMLANLAIPALIAGLPVAVVAGLVAAGVITPEKGKQNLADQNNAPVNQGEGALDAKWDEWRRQMIETNGEGLGDLKYALVTEQQRTEDLLRQNLSRTLPAPIVNLAINTAVSVRSMIDSSEQYYRVGSNTRVVGF